MKNYLVLLLQLQDARQVHDRPFHAIKAFDNEENLLPWTMGLGLALTNDSLEQRLERLHVIMLENPHISPAQPCTKTNRDVIALVGDEKAAF